MRPLSLQCPPTTQQTDLLLTRLGNSEGGDYFLGGQYSLADIATSTLLHRAIILLKDARDIDVHAIIKEEKLDRYAEQMGWWWGEGKGGEWCSATPVGASINLWFLVPGLSFVGTSLLAGCILPAEDGLEDMEQAQTRCWSAGVLTSVPGREGPHVLCTPGLPGLLDGIEFPPPLRRLMPLAGPRRG